MLIKYFEEKIADDLKWDKIGDIPDFPFVNFDETKHDIIKGKFSLGIDFTISNQLARWIYGKKYGVFFLILAATPVIVAIFSITLAFVLSNYYLLLGVVLGFAGQFLSNPYNPIKNLFNSVVVVLFLVFLFSFWQGKETVTYLSAFFVFPFIINSYLYRMNQKKLENIALQSEKIFIYLFQNNKLSLRNNETGQTYFNR